MSSSPMISQCCLLQFCLWLRSHHNSATVFKYSLWCLSNSMSTKSLFESAVHEKKQRKKPKEKKRVHPMCFHLIERRENEKKKLFLIYKRSKMYLQLSPLSWAAFRIQAFVFLFAASDAILQFSILSLFQCLFVQGKSLSIFLIFLNRKQNHIWFRKKNHNE